MSAFDESTTNRRAAGTRAGGQFAPTERAEVNVELSNERAVEVGNVLDDIEPIVSAARTAETIGCALDASLRAQQEYPGAAWIAPHDPKDDLTPWSVFGADGRELGLVHAKGRFDDDAATKAGLRENGEGGFDLVTMETFDATSTIVAASKKASETYLRAHHHVAIDRAAASEIFDDAELDDYTDAEREAAIARFMQEYDPVTEMERADVRAQMRGTLARVKRQSHSKPTSRKSVHPAGSPAARVSAFANLAPEEWHTDVGGSTYITSDGSYACTSDDDEDTGHVFLDGERTDGSRLDGCYDSHEQARRAGLHALGVDDAPSRPWGEWYQ